MPANLVISKQRRNERGIEDLISNYRKMDVGTPKTVEWMLKTAGLMDITDLYFTTSVDDEVGTRGLFLLTKKVTPQTVIDFYRLMVEGYLTGTDFVSTLWVMKHGGKFKPLDLVQTGIVPDEHGENQLEGELRRYWARERGILQPDNISSLRLTPKILGYYCGTYRLDERAYRNLAKKLNLETIH